MTESQKATDAEVLRRRRDGQTYVRISREMGLARAGVAQLAFRRALGRLPATEADQVRIEELLRLDRLSDRVRADTTRAEMDRARQLKTIKRMRDQVTGTG